MVTYDRLITGARVLLRWSISAILLGCLLLAATGASASKPYPNLPLYPDKQLVPLRLPEGWSQWKLLGDGMEFMSSFPATLHEFPVSEAPVLPNLRVTYAGSIHPWVPDTGSTSQGNVPLTRLTEGSQAGLVLRLDAGGAKAVLVRSTGSNILLPVGPGKVVVVGHLPLLSGPALLVDVKDLGFVVVGKADGAGLAVCGSSPVTLARVFEQAVLYEWDTNDQACSVRYVGDLWFPMRAGDVGTGSSDPTAVTAPYGQSWVRIGYLTDAYEHRGTDFDSKSPDGKGRPLYPVWDGGYVCAERSDPVYGNYLILRHRYSYQGRGYYFESLYAHLDWFEPDYSEGDAQIVHTKRLGFSGSTGASRDVHLHLEFRIPAAPVAEHRSSYPTGFFFRKLTDHPFPYVASRPGLPDVPEGWPRPLLEGTLAVVKRLEADVWQVKTEDNDTLYAIKLGPGYRELEVGNRMAVAGWVIDPLYPGGPLVLVTWIRVYVPGAEIS